MFTSSPRSFSHAVLWDNVQHLIKIIFSLRTLLSEMFIVSALPPMSWKVLHICKIRKRKENCAAQASLQKLQQTPEPQGIRKRKRGGIRFIWRGGPAKTYILDFLCLASPVLNFWSMWNEHGDWAVVPNFGHSLKMCFNKYKNQEMDLERKVAVSSCSPLRLTSDLTPLPGGSRVIVTHTHTHTGSGACLGSDPWPYSPCNFGYSTCCALMFSSVKWE